MRYPSYERPLTFFDILSSLFRYKWRVMAVMLLTLVAGAGAILLFPKKYESEANLFVRLGRGSASLDPATIGQTISIQESRESEMNSIVDMLESRGLAERIVNQIGEERILKKYAWIEVTLENATDALSGLVADQMDESTPSDDDAHSISADELKERKRFELAVKEVGKNLRIDSPKKSTTISISYRGRTPELAYDVVTATLACYEEMHIDAYQSSGALAFFDEQFQLQESLVSETEDALREIKNTHAIVTMTGKQESLQTEITDVKKSQLETKAELEAARARVDKLKSDFVELPTEMVSEKTAGIAENARDSMRDRLYELEILEKDLASKYASSHPELVKVREQLRSARSIVDAQPTEREQSTVAVNPVRIKIENELLLAEASVSGLQAKFEALEQLENSLHERLSAVNDLEVQSHDLQRKIDIARENHRSYAKKLEESRINAALDQEALSNVSVVTQPTMRYKHASPKRSLLAVLVVLFSGLCGVATAMFSDYLATAKEMREIRQAERAIYLQELERNATTDPSPKRLESVGSPALIATTDASPESEASDENAGASDPPPKKAK